MALDNLLLEVDTIQPLVKGEEAELLQPVWNQDEQQQSASQRLIEANLHLAVPIAKRHACAGRPKLESIEIPAKHSTCWSSAHFLGGTNDFWDSRDYLQ